MNAKQKEKAGMLFQALKINHQSTHQQIQGLADVCRGDGRFCIASLQAGNKFNSNKLICQQK